MESLDILARLWASHTASLNERNEPCPRGSGEHNLINAMNSINSMNSTNAINAMNAQRYERNKPCPRESGELNAINSTSGVHVVIFSSEKIIAGCHGYLKSFGISFSK